MLNLFGSPRVVNVEDLGATKTASTPSNTHLDTHLDTRKPSAVLIYLASSGTWVDRNYLASLFWGDSEEKKARASLRQAVLYLRKNGWEDALELEKTRVRLNVRTDVKELQEKLEQNDYLAIAQIAKLPFLENYSTGIADFDEWAILERQTLDTIWRNAVLNFSKEASLEQYPEAIELLNTVLERDSLAEEAIQQLLRLCLQSGADKKQQSYFREIGIKAYQKFELGLKEALKLEPLEETQKLYALLQQKTKTNFETSSSNSRKALTPFVGRDLELTDLSNVLEQTGQKLITILGPGGTGKTRLALQLLNLQQDNFTDGTYFIDLSNSNSQEDILYQCVHALGLNLDGNSSVQEQLAKAIVGKEMLLILDNFEHLTEQAELLNDWLTEDGTIKILVTSRNRLNLHLEQVFPLEGLSFVSNATTDHFESSDAVQFFLRTAKRLDPSFYLDTKDNQYVLQICQRLEGLPLGLELTASWLPLMTLEEIATELEQSLDLLDTAPQDTPKRQQSLKEVFEYSWQLLPKNEQRTLASLSIFEEGFSQKAVREITASSRTDLLSLINKSLVQRVRPGRFNLHALVKQYATSKVSNEQCSDLKEAHKNYFLNKLLENVDKLKGSQTQEALDDIAINLRNVQVAYLQALSSLDIEELSQTTWAFRRFYELRARFAEGIYFFEQAEKSIKEIESVQSFAVLKAEQAWLLQCTGRYQDAVDLAEESLEQAKDSETIQLAALQAIGASKMRLGDFEEARGRLEHGFEIANRLGNTSVAASLGSNLGLLHQRLADYDKALEYMYKSLTAFRKLKDSASSTTLLNNISDVLLSQERPVEALPLLEEGIQLSKEGEYWRFYPYLLFNAGRALTMLGKPDDALTHLEEAITYAKNNKDPYLEAWVEQALAEALRTQGHFQKAETHLINSLRIASDTDNTPLSLDNLLILAKTVMDSQSELAAELLGYVANHNQVLEIDRREAESLLKALNHHTKHLEDKDIGYVINYVSTQINASSIY